MVKQAKFVFLSALVLSASEGPVYEDFSPIFFPYSGRNMKIHRQVYKKLSIDLH